MVLITVPMKDKTGAGLAKIVFMQSVKPRKGRLFIFLAVAGGLGSWFFKYLLHELHEFYFSEV